MLWRSREICCSPASRSRICLRARSCASANSLRRLAVREQNTTISDKPLCIRNNQKPTQAKERNVAARVAAERNSMDPHTNEARSFLMHTVALNVHLLLLLVGVAAVETFLVGLLYGGYIARQSGLVVRNTVLRSARSCRCYAKQPETRRSESVMGYGRRAAIGIVYLTFGLRSARLGQSNLVRGGENKLVGKLLHASHEPAR